MKKMLLPLIGLIGLFMFSNMAFAQHQGGSKGEGQGHGSYHGQGSQGHYNNYHGRPGYRSEPYNKGPHQGYYNHYPNHNYYGHWNSWNSWNGYCSRYPQFQRYGHYERYNGQLYFLFNDGLNSFGFSIGGVY